jgi:putative aldouronate transport system substrate-binding protein
MKKWIMLLLVFVLAFSTIVGCASNNNEQNTQGTNGNNSSNSPSGDASGENASEEPTEFSISMRTLKFGYVENHTNINEDKWVKELESRTNTDLDIKLVPHAEFEQKMAQMFAINDIPDVVQGSGGVAGKELAGSVEAGVFMPLDDLLQEHGQDLLNIIPQEAWDQQKYDGKIMAIPEWLGNPARRATWIRTDLLEQTGLDIPKTVDEYLNVLRAFKELGVKQPFAARENLKYADMFFGAYDVYPYLSMFEQQGDQIVPKFFDSENMQAAIGVYKTMFDEGLISQEFATVNPTTFKNAILAGDVGIWNMNANELLQWTGQLQENVPEARTAIIPSPVGPDGKGGHYLYGPVTRAYFINNEVDQEKAANIIKFFNWMVSEEAKTFFTFGIEGDTYTKDGDKINYTSPTDTQGIDEERYRTAFLWMVQDTTYNEGILGLTEEGANLIEVYDTLLANEGRDGIKFEPRLESLQENPDISPLSDVPAPVIRDHIVRMIYGQEPISNWPEVIEEWKSKGGNAVIEEATERFNSKQGVSMPLR